jgi:hypothetical protein
VSGYPGLENLIFSQVKTGLSEAMSGISDEIKEFTPTPESPAGAGSSD